MTEFGVQAHCVVEGQVRAFGPTSFRPPLKKAASFRTPEAHTQPTSGKLTANAVCEWCGEDFNNSHWQFTTACCGFWVGHSCLEEVYDEEDACWNCSTPRPAQHLTEPVVSEQPVYIRRFVDGPKTAAKAQKMDHHVYEDLQQPDSLADETELEVTYLKPLFQASLGAKDAPQVRTRLIDAIDCFVQLWKSEAGKLRVQDRAFVVDRAQQALAGCFLLNLFRYDRQTDVF